MSSRSIRTMSRIESRESMRLPYQNIRRHARPWAGHPRLHFGPKDVDGRDKPGHDEHSNAPESRELPQPDLLEGLADPGALILVRLEATALHQPVGFLVPLAVGEIVPEDSCGGLRLVDDAERHVHLGQAHPRLLDVARGLILRDDDLETVDRRHIVAFLLIEARGLHFLAGELITRDLH